MNRPYLLARLAGAQPELLRQAPSDRVRQAAMGGVLVTTAMVAGVSAAFALNMAVKVPVEASVVVGVLWAWVIFNLDRMLVVSMVRQSGWFRNVLTALPRVLLAVVIGAVISVPLLLRIFEPEIDNEIQVMRGEQSSARTAAREQQFAAITDLERQQSDLQAVISGNTRSDVTSNSEVSRLTAEVKDKEAEFTTANNAVICEAEGKCGSGQVGRGPATREKKENSDRLAGELAQLNKQRDDAIAAAQQQLAQSATKDVADANAKLAVVEDELTKQRAAEERKRVDDESAVQGSDGLLARLQALNRLSGNDLTMAMAHWSLGLLFVLIELLPVLVKLLALFGPETHYERLVDRQEAFLNTDYGSQLDLRKQRAALRTDTQLKIDQDRAVGQLEAGKEANALMTATQSTIAAKAIDVWSQIAMSRSEDELARWYAQHVGQPTGASVIVPAQATGPRPRSTTTPTTTPIAPTAPTAQPAPAASAAVPPLRPRAAPIGVGGYSQFKASVAAAARSGSGIPSPGPSDPSTNGKIRGHGPAGS